MAYVKKIFLFLFCACIIVSNMPVSSSIDYIEGLSFTVTKMNNFPLDKKIVKDYDLYELYISNTSNTTYSIPGYSIDFGVDYVNILELSNSLKNSLSKRLAFLNLAAGALFLPFGSIARNAARTAVGSVTSLKRKANNVDDDSQLLSSKKTYVLYPNENIALYFLLSNQIGKPSKVRFICRDEELNLNHVLIDTSLDFKEVTIKNKKEVKKKYNEQGFQDSYFDDELNEQVEKDIDNDIQDDFLSEPSLEPLH